ncbi:MAG: DUF4340 domain-containing protein [Bacteroidales bacterium]|nr:DUF4340 domain-containing protein [Bacteroidales bacterium]
MSKKFNNKYLLIAFAALILLFVFVKFYRSVKTESTLKTDIVKIDTVKISKILLYPLSEKGMEIVFSKEGKEWKASNGKITTETQKNTLGNLLYQLIDIKPKRLASRSKDKWAEYQVTDTSAIRVKVFEGEKEVLNLYIGKFTYQQVSDPSGSGRNGVVGTSYVRLADEKEVYAVDGFLSFGFNQPFNSWRNQSFVHFNKSDITKITFRYPGDSSFVAELKAKKWTVNNQPVDSIKLNNYLAMLGNKTASTFDDNYTPVGNSQFQITIEGNNMSNITVDGFAKDNSNFVINSSLNPKSWFTSDTKGLFKEVFVGMKGFMPGKKKQK